MNIPYLENIQQDSAYTQYRWCSYFGINLVSCPLSSARASDGILRADKGLSAQADLINTLYIPDPIKKFAIRYIVYPEPTSFSAGRIEVGLLVKICAASEAEVVEYAKNMYNQLIMLLGGTFPDYIWRAVEERDAFLKLWQPFDWTSAHIVEIRRREDLVQLDKPLPIRSIGFSTADIDSKSGPERQVYFIHPFSPRLGNFERILRTMLLHNETAVLTAIISPTRLEKKEERILMEEIAKCEGYINPPMENLQRVYNQRAQLLIHGHTNQFLRLQDAPFLFNVSLSSPSPIPPSLSEAVGVAISTPIGQKFDERDADLTLLLTGGYDILVPDVPEQLEAARKNAQNLEYEIWGDSLAPSGLQRLRFLVDGREASSAFRFPIDSGDGLPGLVTHSRRVHPIARDMVPMGSNGEHRCTLIGTNNFLGLEQNVFIMEQDRLQHLYVVGQTGTGKTTLLKTMIFSDMQAGRGLAVIDPHGDLFEELLGSIPTNRMEDVVVLDASDMQFPVGLNLLECNDEEQRQFVVREMRAIMKRLIEDLYQHRASEYTGPIFYQHMQMNMLLTMSDFDNPGTLLQFYEIFNHRDYWERWLPLKWKDPMLERWVNEVLPDTDYPRRNNPQEASFGEYINSKFMDFMFDPRLRMIFGQPYSTINLNRIMDEGKILLVNLAKGSLGEANAQFLGLILMAKIQAAAMSRVKIDPKNRNSFYLYVDEFHSLATENFSVMVSEARKFGVGLILANQFISQIKDESIINAIFGNVGTILSFRLGWNDAERIEGQFYPFFNRTDLVNLPNWQTCVKTTNKGQSIAPFSLNTILSPTAPSEHLADKIRRISQEKYGRNREEVEKIITQSLALDQGKSSDSDNGPLTLNL